MKLAGSVLGAQGNYGAVTDLANEFAVSRPTVYRARDEAEAALARWFEASVTRPPGVVVYADAFIRKRPAIAAKVMKAYLRGVRYYLGSLAGGKIAGANADEIIDVLAKYSTLKDKGALREIVPTALDGDGRLNVESLAKDLAFFKAQDLVKSKVTVDQVVDLSWIEAAVRDLGPWKPK